MIYSINGSNYGDEGKGLATDYFASKSDSVLVARHNGGAQSGHTVEIDDKRFVFHQLSSGSFRGADTYWAETYFPDIFKLSDEVNSFYKLSGFRPKIFASPLACITTIDDVLINMLLESSRGENRHGSCGMGINEAFLRKECGFGITLEQLFSYSASEFYNELIRIRKNYTFKRLSNLNLTGLYGNEYYDMLADNSVLYNFSENVCKNLTLVSLKDKSVFDKYENIIFEAGQGLRLDADFKESIPHVTASKTGLTNVIKILNKCGKKLDKVIYVTRSYLTKHGAGPLENEFSKPDSIREDRTNISNLWQGNFRYARFESIKKFTDIINDDIKNCPYCVNSALFITHLNETDNKLLFKNQDIPVEDFIKDNSITHTFSEFLLSDSPFSDKTKINRRNA